MSRIVYPRSNSKHIVGVTAPSSGLGTDVFRERFDLVKRDYEKNGFSVLEGKLLRENEKSVSGDSKSRARDFMTMWDDSQVDLIQPPWGGEFLIDILEYIDFDSLLKTPTWVMGYSDISTLLFAITTKTGIATVHGANFMDSIDGQDDLTSKSKSFLELSPGESFSQKSGDKWQEKFIDFSEKISATFNLTEKTSWKILNKEQANFSGRIIGGCFDTLRNLVGTPYGDLVGFHHKYCKNEGLILYLENCNGAPNDLYRGLLGMKYAGWFEGLNGVVFGRNNAKDDGGLTYMEVLEKVFIDAPYPVVFDADIGHKPPQATIINGSVATFKVEKGKAVVVQELI